MSSFIKQLKAKPGEVCVCGVSSAYEGTGVLMHHARLFEPVESKTTLGQQGQHSLTDIEIGCE